METFGLICKIMQFLGPKCESRATAGSAYFVVGAAWGWITALKHEVTKTRRTDGGSTTTIFYRRDAEDAENDGINHPGAAGINSGHEGVGGRRNRRWRRWAQMNDGRPAAADGSDDDGGSPSRRGRETRRDAKTHERLRGTEEPQMAQMTAENDGANHPGAAGINSGHEGAQRVPGVHRPGAAGINIFHLVDDGGKLIAF